MAAASNRVVSLYSRFHLVKMGCRKAVAIWAYVSSLMFALFHLVYKMFLRCDDYENHPSNLSEIHYAAKSIEAEEVEPEEFVDSISGLSDEAEPTDLLILSFKFPTFEEFAQNHVEEDKADACRVKESDFDSKVCSFDGMEGDEIEIPKSFVEERDSIDEQNPKKTDFFDEEEPQFEGMKSDFSIEQKKFFMFSEKELLDSGSDSDSTGSSPGFSVMSRFLDSTSEGEEEELIESNDKAEEFDEEVLGKSKETEESELDDQWEHQDLIEQLKMELKRVKATGLPTIDENSEPPKVMDDLKPWKIDDRGATAVSELHKIYKSYRDRMRKFDILNYQKMYALGFLKTKDPIGSIPTQTQSSSSYLASILPPALCLCNKKKPKQDDPISRFIGELHGDLETVYVGQLCLSWEFLHWQYEKALDLWELDQFLVRCYNEVAGEFQQLQVLMQRFLENEEFEGPRVQYYVKSRCFLRNLLQVPVIREDNTKAKWKDRVEKKGELGVTSDVLVEIIEESIRVFWRFVRVDKDKSSSALNRRKGFLPELQDLADLDMFIEVQTALQKKEKKLKELLKGGNCILKKLKKHHEETEEEEGGSSSSSSDQVLAFFSQVDMKLVRRVLNMSRLSTDHLTWCREKLSKINFVRRRIHVEPSFLLFPC